MYLFLEQGKMQLEEEKNLVQLVLRLMKDVAVQKVI